MRKNGVQNRWMALLLTVLLLMQLLGASGAAEGLALRKGLRCVCPRR